MYFTWAVLDRTTPNFLVSLKIVNFVVVAFSKSLTSSSAQFTLLRKKVSFVDNSVNILPFKVNSSMHMFEGVKAYL